MRKLILIASASIVLLTCGADIAKATEFKPNSVETKKSFTPPNDQVPEEGDAKGAAARMTV